MLWRGKREEKDINRHWHLWTTNLAFFFFKLCICWIVFKPIMRFRTSAFVSAYMCFLKREHLSFFFLKMKTCSVFLPLKEAIQRGKRACAQRAALATQPHWRESQGSLLYLEEHTGGPGKLIFFFSGNSKAQKAKHVINMSHKTTGTIIWCNWSAGPSWADGSFRNPTPFHTLLILYVSGMFTGCYLEHLHSSNELVC